MKPLNIFTEYHHSALYRSFEILFEKRLGWKLFSPIGHEWYRNLAWRYSTNPGVVEQFLKIPQDAQLKDGIYYVPSLRYGGFRKCLTFDAFKKFPIDIMLASVGPHQFIYDKLCQLHFKKPKLIRQVGNIPDPCYCPPIKNVMDSTGVCPLPKGVNVVQCRQEFDFDHFNYEPSHTSNTIKCFVNCFPTEEFYDLWLEYKKLLPDFIWKMHGINCDDGIIGTENEIAKAMKDTTFIWHVKKGCEGYGHVIHNAFAIGRPLITKISTYKGKMAEPLLEDLVTCIDLDKRTPKENAELIREFSRPDKYKQMCDNVYKRFKEVCDFDKEEKEIRKFLERLQ